MRRRRLAFLVWFVGTMALAPVVAAADPLVVSGRLTPPVENPVAGPHGHGVAALTISADGTQMTYRITYGRVGAPITAVYFCSGSIPRDDPLALVCGFTIPEGAGGPSPITGSRSISPTAAAILESGYAVIELDSASGIQLAGWIELGPPPPDTATVPMVGAHPPLVGFFVPALAGLIAFGAALLGPRGAKRYARSVLGQPVASTS